MKVPVTFYYLCDNYEEELCCVIISEEREASGHAGDLTYLMSLYLMGPSGEDLVSALHPGTRILSVSETDGCVILELTDTANSMTDIEFSLASACLTLTCMDITDAEEVTIRSGEREVTMNQENLALYDNSAEPTPSEDTK